MGKQRYFKTQGDITRWIRENESTLRFLYFDKNMTARKVAENQNVHFDQRFAKVLARELGKKGMGLGGMRIGSGNKKGVEWCDKPNCRKKKNSCQECTS